MSDDALVNDRAVVKLEYLDEERFLARRLTTWAELRGPLVEDEAITALAEGAPSRLLEVGCGTGDFTERVQRDLGVALVATDLSPRMVELTGARGLDARQADIEALPFADAIFDVVLANRVLYHVPNLDHGLAEIVRVLRPGGRLVAVTYSQGHLREFYDIVGGAGISRTFSAETASASLKQHFASVERRDVIGAAVFHSTEDLVGLSGQRFGHFTAPGPGHRLLEVELPFKATYRHAIFIATK